MIRFSHYMQGIDHELSRKVHYHNAGWILYEKWERCADFIGNTESFVREQHGDNT
jgi:hypothetical protein